MRPYRSTLILALAATAFLGFVAAQPCAAQITWTVETTDDDGGENTLRAALAFASDGDTINITATGTINLSPFWGPLMVDKSVTITGPGKENLTLDGGLVLGTDGTPIGGMPIFWVGVSYYEIPYVTATISGLTIANGANVDGYGGAIGNAGTLTLDNCALTGSYAEWGGAICNIGILTLTECTLSNNTAAKLGGAIMTCTLPLAGEYSTPHDVTLTAIRCTFSGNTVTDSGWLDGGGAICNYGAAATAALNIEDSTLSSNSGQGGGAIFNLSAGDTSVSPTIPGHGTVNIVRSTLEGNTAGLPGGTPIALGGAIVQVNWDEASSGALTVDRCTLNNNAAVSPVVSAGGAICDFIMEGTGSVVVKNSTIVGNASAFTEDADPVATEFAIGGAILELGGALTVDNCTLSGNVDDGGLGIPARASGIGVGPGGSLLTKNSIFANDASGPNLSIIHGEDPVPGAITSAGYNIATDDGGGFLTATGDQLNTDPLLGALADNGGPTWTCALQSGSPAIDAGALADSAGIVVTADQRGIERPQGSANDIGAFELEQASTSALVLSDVTIRRNNNKTYTVTVVIGNPDETTAYDVTVTSATLDGAATNSVLPLVYGAIKPGTTKKCTLQFKNVDVGEQTLTVNGTCSLGAFFATIPVIVP